ncbi:serine hydrolase domain-containing protein [Singulisphaera sp. PoT]|uniref:serine hydrolase domain-containing protein n=1 Tax=Singulisphaera sp. PoT TaxID=3411797 RepID=UPI003BF4FE40
MRSRPLALPLLVLLVAARVGFAETPAPPKTFDVKSIDAYVSAVVGEEKIPGLGLAIARDGKIVLAKGYGKCSLDEGAAPVEAETTFAAGSVTKQLVCACVLLLAEEGKLSIDDKVSKYFPDLTKAGEITLHQLMAHTSGYPDFYPLDFVDRRMAKPIEPDALIAEYAGGKLDFEPGHRWSYSNTGYTILGRVVEKVTGQPFGEFFKARLLSPLGMTHSVFEPTEPLKGGTRGYLSIATGPLVPAKPEAHGWLYTAGGLFASAPDLARWDLGLMDGKVLKPETFRIMTTGVKLADGRVRDYGCGLQIARRDGETILTHGGAISGFRASNTLIPRTKSAVVLLTNSEAADLGPISQAIVGLLIKDEAEPEVPKVAGPSPREAGLEFLHAMQAGKLDRDKLGEEFSLYMTDEHVKSAAARLKPLGQPDEVEVDAVRERGGMEVAALRFVFKGVTLKGLLYRTPDGKIQQLLFVKD